MTTTPTPPTPALATFEAAATHLAHVATTGQPPLPHQLQAFRDAWARATPEHRELFSQAWRAAPATPAAPPAPAASPAAVAVALPLVQKFEGCKLTAYPDPETGGEPWTIGWGSTRDSQGRPFKEGDRISQEQADALLASRLNRDAQQLGQRIPCWRQLNTNQQGALLSFTYNCGPYWFGSEGFATITRALQAGELEAVPAALMLYVNPGGPSEAGLRRRRQEEGALWSSSPARPTRPGNLLTVPWYPQLDSATDHGRRMCFSSCCAMLLEFLKPNTLHGANGDDQYLARVREYGDTTDPVAQIQGLNSYGVRATFRRNATRADLQDSIDRGIPVPCGYLHRGPVTAPTGKGHYLIVIGYSQLGVWVNDPWADMNLVTGVEDGPARPRVLYSWENWLPRWQVEGEGTGWGVFARR